MVGRIAGAFGVRGWVRLMSFTDPPENLVHYRDWSLVRPAAPGTGAAQPRAVRLAQWQWHGGRLVGRLEGVEDRDGAQAIVGAEISVPREQLSPAGADTWYWADLMEAEVRNLEGVVLGRLVDVMDNGAQDIMVLRNAAGTERLVPFVREVIVKAVDLPARQIVVDWGEDY